MLQKVRWPKYQEKLFEFDSQLQKKMRKTTNKFRTNLKKKFFNTCILPVIIETMLLTIRTGNRLQKRKENYIVNKSERPQRKAIKFENKQ